MQPTYSVYEIKLLIKSLDCSSIILLKELIEEEKNNFLEYELKAIYQYLKLKNKEILRNEINTEFLLSFN